MKQVIRNVKIIGTGSYVPEKIYTNKYLETIVDTNAEWIENTLGIKERRIASENQATSDLAFQAGKKAIENANLAKDAIKDFNSNLELIELSGIASRMEEALLINASDLLLMTSFSEGSPQVIKEALACNIPIVSTDVGDVKLLIGKTEGTFIANFDPVDVRGQIKNALGFSKVYGKTNGVNRIKKLKLDSCSVAGSVVRIYTNTFSSS